MQPAGASGRLDVRITEKRFRSADGGSVHVLSDLAFSVAAGSFTCLIGPSGCGKTTTLRIILGLDTDYGGTIGLPGPAVRMAAIFQEPRLLPWRTVEQNVRLALSKEEAEKPLDELFDILGLADMRERYPGELSVGQARRVALARAFAVKPDLLLLDEPFVSLDAATAARLRGLLIQVWRSRPTTALMVTHNVREAVELADRLVFLTPCPARVAGEMKVPNGPAPQSGEAMGDLISDIKRRFPGAAEEWD